MKPDAIILGTLLQGTRGMLLIVFNWVIFIDYGRIRSIPGVDVMVAIPSPAFFLLGFMDILMAKRLWSKGSNGWGYCIVMSAVYCCIFFLYTITTLLTPYYLNYWRHTTILIIVVTLFAMAELVALVTPGARNY